MPDGAPNRTTRRLEGNVLTVHIPMRLARIGGRKVVLSPEGEEWTPATQHADGALIRALGRAHRWQRLLDNGTYGSAAELAAAEKMNPSYLSRLLRLTLLAPDIVDAILEGRQSPGMQVQTLLHGFPLDWREQRSAFEVPNPHHKIS